MNQLPCLEIGDAPTFEVLAKLPHQRVMRDWYGTNIPFLAEYLLAVTSNRLHFHVRVDKKPIFDPAYKEGDFVEGLWTKDCAELFIREGGSQKYQEFNLSPSGAWWSAHFSAPRIRAGVASKSAVCAKALVTAQGWRGWLSIDLNALEVSGSLLQSTLANVTFILNHPDEHFYSASDLGSGEPDFHRIDSFMPWAVQSGSAFALNEGEV